MTLYHITTIKEGTITAKLEGKYQLYYSPRWAKGTSASETSRHNSELRTIQYLPSLYCFLGIPHPLDTLRTASTFCGHPEHEKGEMRLTQTIHTYLQCGKNSLSITIILQVHIHCCCIFLTTALMPPNTTTYYKGEMKKLFLLMPWKHTEGLIFLISGLYRGDWLTSRSDQFILREIDVGTHWTGDWVGPRAGLQILKDRKISCPCPESNPELTTRSLDKFH
jgi:hypothetical protein